MTVPMSDGEENVYLHSIAFNQDASCFAVGTTAGFRVYGWNPPTNNAAGEAVSGEESLHQLRQSLRTERSPNVGAPLGTVKMLFKTNLFGIVRAPKEGDNGTCDRSHKVIIWDDLGKNVIYEVLGTKGHPVLNFVWRKDVMVMVCEYSLRVFDCDKMNIIYKPNVDGSNKNGMGSNKNGLCALASASDPWMICFPGSKGSVLVHSPRLQSNYHIQAHDRTLGAIAVNDTGTLVATADETGTVVKVFRTGIDVEGNPTGNCEQLYDLWRGHKPAVISSLAFRNDDRFMAAASSSSTIHVFKLQGGKDEGGCGSEASRSDAEQAGQDTAYGSAYPNREASGGEQGGEQNPAAGIANIASIQELASKEGAMAVASTVGSALLGFARTATTELQKEVVKNVPVSGLFVAKSAHSKFAIPAADDQNHRAPTSQIEGPQVAFHGNLVRVVHHNGCCYEFFYDDDIQGSGRLMQATTWFSPDPNFEIKDYGQGTTVTSGEAGEAGAPGAEADPWTML